MNDDWITELFTVIDNYGTGVEARNFINAHISQREVAKQTAARIDELERLPFKESTYGNIVLGTVIDNRIAALGASIEDPAGRNKASEEQV